MLPALALALAAVVVPVLAPHRQAPGPPANSLPRDSGAVPADLYLNLTTIPLQTFDAVGAREVLRPSLVGSPRQSSQPPMALYIGAEFCPNCAAMRWPVVTALARFGRFTGLALSTSSATDVFPGTPTFTFLHAGYRSSDLILQTVELQGNIQDANGRYPPLQRPTAAQIALIRKYDPQGQIPFFLVGGAYLWIGSPFSPALLQGQDWHTIGAALPSGRGTAAQAILAAGNEIAAAVCMVDGDIPAAVCRSAGVREAAQTLPTAPR
jgi:hypothetical protein